MDFPSVKSLKLHAQKWNISQRRVQILCSEGRISGVFKLGEAWAIPDETKKPKDTFFATILLMYISMKQLQNTEDEYVVISEDEMLEVANYIEFARVLPEFKKFVKEINNE